MSAEELTKKEQIINFAQNDPFLKISDIAEYVQTTPRYVRTILSEANISLMKLREKYARSMEKRLQTPEETENTLSVHLRPLKGEMEVADFGIEELLAEEHEELQKITKEERLWRIHQLHNTGQKPFCVKELITFFPDDLNTETLSNLESVYELFGRKGINRLHFKEHIVRFELPTEEVRAKLGLSHSEKAMVVSRYILLNKIPIGTENYYFKADQIQMSIPGELIM